MLVLQLAPVQRQAELLSQVVESALAEQASYEQLSPDQRHLLLAIQVVSVAKVEQVSFMQLTPSHRQVPSFPQVVVSVLLEQASVEHLESVEDQRQAKAEEQGDYVAWFEQVSVLQVTSQRHLSAPLQAPSATCV